MTTTDQRDRIAADETPKPIPKRRRPAWWVYVTLVLLILLGGVGGFYGVWHYRANSELQAAIAAARQRGEPVWFADLEPEPIPAEENAAPFFIEAAELLGPESTAFDAALRQAMQTSRVSIPTRRHLPSCARG
ncbi:MAG: hypothetical protein HYS13_24140 [Planctomycetia bacterium]|nr:hypothetical protein [Planctomycetia bacterium]